MAEKNKPLGETSQKKKAKKKIKAYNQAVLERRDPTSRKLVSNEGHLLNARTHRTGQFF